MDALRLIKTARHALAEARSVPDVLAEAWQAGLLTEAVGARIAERADGEVGALGQLLCDAGAHAVSCLDGPEGDPADDGGGDRGDADWGRSEWGGSGRVGRLGELGDLTAALTELGLLLNEVAETLVVLACGADAESLYWRCIDGVDAGAECKDLVAELLRTVRKEAESDSERGSEPAIEFLGPGLVGPGPVADRGREGDVGLPMLVVPLGPPVAKCGYRPWAGDSAGGQVGSVGGESARPFAGSCSSAVRAAEDCRSAPRPARSALTEASSSCICSSRLLGGMGAVGVGGSPEAVSCGATGASDQGSDMSGPLQLGSAL